MAFRLSIVVLHEQMPPAIIIGGESFQAAAAIEEGKDRFGRRKILGMRRKTTDAPKMAWVSVRSNGKPAGEEQRQPHLISEQLHCDATRLMINPGRHYRCRLAVTTLPVGGNDAAALHRRARDSATGSYSYLQKPHSTVHEAPKKSNVPMRQCSRGFGVSFVSTSYARCTRLTVVVVLSADRRH